MEVAQGITQRHPERPSVDCCSSSTACACKCNARVAKDLWVVRLPSFADTDEKEFLQAEPQCQQVPAAEADAEMAVPTAAAAALTTVMMLECQHEDVSESDIDIMNSPGTSGAVQAPQRSIAAAMAVAPQNVHEVEPCALGPEFARSCAELPAAELAGLPSEPAAQAPLQAIRQSHSPLPDWHDDAQAMAQPNQAAPAAEAQANSGKRSRSVFDAAPLHNDQPDTSTNPTAHCARPEIKIPRQDQWMEAMARSGHLWQDVSTFPRCL